jgi:hypothetical protein
MNWKLLIVLCLATCSFACDKEIREAKAKDTPQLLGGFRPSTGY